MSHMKDIQLNKVSKAYGDKKILVGLSLRFRAGEITCIKGPSGCGKTTLLRILSGLEKEDSGIIENVPERIAYMFQEDRLCEDFNAVSNIRLVTGDRFSKAEIMKNFEELGLQGHSKGPVRTFSGGMKRRVAIVRTILYGADLVVLDEPFKGLDPELRSKVIDYVKNHTEGKTVLCVTHDDLEVKLMGGNLLDLGEFCMGREERNELGYYRV